MADEFDEFRKPPDEFDEFRTPPQEPPPGWSLGMGGQQPALAPRGMATPHKRGPRPPPGSEFNPLQEQGVSFEERTAVKAAPNVASAIEWLRRQPGMEGKATQFSALPFGLIPTSKTKQYEAHEYRPGEIAVRPAGTKEPYKVVDPDKPLLSLETLKDVFDIGPELASAVSSPVTKPLQIAGLAGIEELGRGAIAEHQGFKDTHPREQLGRAARSAAMAGVTAKALPLIPKALQAPHKAIEKVTLQGPKQALAQAEARAAKEAAERASKLEADLARGRETAKAMGAKGGKAPEVPLPTPEPELSPFEKYLEGLARPPKSGFKVPTGTIHPATGFLAKTLKELPDFEELLRRNFGSKILVPGQSRAIKTRETFLRTLAEDLTSKERNDLMAKYSREVSEWMLGSPRFQAMTEEAKQAAAKMARGEATAAEASLVERVLAETLEKHSTPAYVLHARSALKTAQANKGRKALEDIYRFRGRLGSAFAGAAFGGGFAHPAIWALLGAPLGARASAALGRGIERGAGALQKHKATAGAAQRALRTLPFLAPNLAR